MTVFQPFLRPVGAEDRARGDTVWLKQLLNEERAKVGEPPALHDNVLRATRTAREKLGEIGLLNFEETSYLDKQGRSQRLIRFSDDVLLNVVAEVGGKVERQLLHRANVEFNRLNRTSDEVLHARLIDHCSLIAKEAGPSRQTVYRTQDDPAGAEAALVVKSGTILSRYAVNRIPSSLGTSIRLR